MPRIKTTSSRSHAQRRQNQAVHFWPRLSAVAIDEAFLLQELERELKSAQTSQHYAQAKLVETRHKLHNEQKRTKHFQNALCLTNQKYRRAHIAKIDALESALKAMTLAETMENENELLLTEKIKLENEIAEAALN